MSNIIKTTPDRLIGDLKATGDALARPPISPTLYNTTEAAEYLRLSRSCMAKWRCAGGGPCFILAGRKVLYAKAVLDAWLASRSRRSTSDQGQ